MAGVMSACGDSPGCSGRRQRPGDAGFTLVEVSVTVAIIGILAAIAIPSFKGVLPKVKLGNATQTLANQIAMSRFSAISKSSEYQVVFDPVADSYRLRQFTITATDSTPRWRENSTTTLGESTDLEGVTYLFDGLPAPNTLQIFANGSTSVPIYKQALAITLQTRDATIKKRVVVWTTGRIYSEKWNGTTWVED